MKIIGWCLDHMIHIIVFWAIPSASGVWFGDLLVPDEDIACGQKIIWYFERFPHILYFLASYVSI